MKIQLLIAINDIDYAEHLSRVLTEKGEDIFEVSLCSKPELLEDILKSRSMDVALLDEEMANQADLSAIRLPLLVWDGISEPGEGVQKLGKIRKYQRISTISSDVALQYATACGVNRELGPDRASITAVWSPVGGVGKTTVALAFALRKAVSEKRSVYLDLEPFSTSPVYFEEAGKSISTVFEKLSGDVALLFQSIRQQDKNSGIFYFGCPQNYDDINILTSADIVTLLQGCATNADELVVDLGSVCNDQVRQVLTMADRVLLVVDGSAVSREKYRQFSSQHDVYAGIADKTVVVANKGARNVGGQGKKAINLPRVDSDDPVVVYKTLSAYMS